MIKGSKASNYNSIKGPSNLMKIHGLVLSSKKNMWNFEDVIFPLNFMDI
jgi:hypothetical protein